MKHYQLSYCDNFKCIADKCKHTCCAGWQMNIDEKTLGDYKNNTSEFSATLKKGIDFKRSRFKANKLGRCAFLNDKNLCDIIINLGEKSLCQVCTDHPRFRSFFNDRVELGLGFCCEQATKIILSYADKIQPILTSDDGKTEQLDFNEKNVLEFRTKALNIIQDREIDINDRIKNLLKECHFDFDNFEFKKLVKLLLSLEKINKSWINTLKTLKTKPFNTTTNYHLSIIAEQFLVNSLFRHLSDAEDTLWVRARAIACVIFWWIILNTFEQNNTDIFDVVREFSVEIEYSQNNLDKLFNFAYKFIKL